MCILTLLELYGLIIKELLILLVDFYKYILPIILAMFKVDRVNINFASVVWFICVHV